MDCGRIVLSAALDKCDVCMKSEWLPSLLKSKLLSMYFTWDFNTRIKLVSSIKFGPHIFLFEDTVYQNTVCMYLEMQNIEIRFSFYTILH